MTSSPGFTHRKKSDHSSINRPASELDAKVDAKVDTENALPGELISAGSQHLHRRLGGKEIQLLAIGGAIGTCMNFLPLIRECFFSLDVGLLTSSSSLRADGSLPPQRRTCRAVLGLRRLCHHRAVGQPVLRRNGHLPPHCLSLRAACRTLGG